MSAINRLHIAAPDGSAKNTTVSAPQGDEIPVVFQNVIEIELRVGAMDA